MLRNMNHMSSDQNLAYLLYLGDYTAQLGINNYNPWHKDPCKPIRIAMECPPRVLLNVAHMKW